MQKEKKFQNIHLVDRSKGKEDVVLLRKAQQKPPKYIHEHPKYLYWQFLKNKTVLENKLPLQA